MTAPAVAARLRRMEAETIRRLCAVPEPMTVTEWADRYRMLPDTSTAPGPYRSEVAPYVRRPQDCLGDPGIGTVVLCWAAQTLKSTTLENGIGYRIHRMPSPLIVVQPKIDAAESWAKERLVPMIVATPALRERVQLGKASESTLRYKRFAGGFLFVASAQSATELASRSSGFVLCDEVDRYEVIPGEGSPVEIVARRSGAADIGLLALTSTPRDAETTIIWPYLEGGTFELYHVPCPHCGHEQPLVWDRLRFKGLAAPVYLCRACEEPVEEREKPGLLAAGQWVATNPDAPYPSFHLNALYSPFAKSGWAALAAEWERAHGKPADLQVFVNTRLAELWTETGESLDANALLAEGRLDEYEEGVVPDLVGVLTAGGDVQGNRIETYLWGWGAGLESWLVAREVFVGDPHLERGQPGSPWDAVDAWLARAWPRADGGSMRVSAAFIDSGYATSQVYRFTKRTVARRIHAAKGIGGPGLPILGKPTVQTKERVILYPIGVDAAKTEFIRSQLPEPSRGPGFVHLPTWLDTEFVEQMVAEKRYRRVHRGRVIYEWRRKRDDAPNEALDCRILARAALERLGAATIAALGTLAQRAAAAASAASTDQMQDPALEPQHPALMRRPPAPRGGFVHGWKRR